MKESNNSDVWNPIWNITCNGHRQFLGSNSGWPEKGKKGKPCKFELLFECCKNVKVCCHFHLQYLSFKLYFREPSRAKVTKTKFAERLRKEKFGVYLEEAEMTKGGRNVTSENHEIKTARVHHLKVIAAMKNLVRKVPFIIKTRSKIIAKNAFWRINHLSQLK